MFFELTIFKAPRVSDRLASQWRTLPACDVQDGVPARAIIEVRGRPRGSQISAPAHREPSSARLSHPTA
jgi:hypothetical protein